MTIEASKEDFFIPSDVPGFWKLVVSEFLKTEAVRNIETIAQKLVERQGMERFKSETEDKEKIKGRLKEFLGEEEIKKIEDKEGHRWLLGDRDVVSAAGG